MATKIIGRRLSAIILFFKRWQCLGRSPLFTGIVVTSRKKANMPSKSKPTVQAHQSAAKHKKTATASADVPPKVQKSRKLAQVTGQPSPITAPN